MIKTSGSYNTIKIMQKEKVVLTVTEDDNNRKIDRFIKKFFQHLSFSEVAKMLRKGDIKVNGRRQKVSYLLQTNDVLQIYGKMYEKQEKILTAQHQGLARQLIDNILYMDENILVLNKPSGLAVQGGNKVKISVDDLGDLLKLGLKNKPKLVHRIDRDTSGVLIMSRNDETARILCKMFQEQGTIKKYYLALCNGSPNKQQGTISIPLAKMKLDGNQELMSYCPTTGDDAVTHYKVLQCNQKVSLIQFNIVTGRTHQVRAHAAISGIPIVGDLKYDSEYSEYVMTLLTPKEKQLFILNHRPSKLPGEKQLYLHSEVIELEIYGKNILVRAPLPNAFADAIERYF
jgi:23S rRNA pseudouridine955/2504/2580 synthase